MTAGFPNSTAPNPAALRLVSGDAQSVLSPRIPYTKGMYSKTDFEAVSTPHRILFQRPEGAANRNVDAGNTDRIPLPAATPDTERIRLSALFAPSRNRCV